MRRTERVSVDGKTFAITQLALAEQQELYHVVAKVVVPALGVLDSIEKLDEVAIFRAMASVAANMPPETMKRVGELLRRGSKLVTVSGTTELLVEMNDGIYADEFDGEIAHWQNWVLAGLKVNFSGFLPRGAGGKSSSPVSPAAEPATTS